MNELQLKSRRFRAEREADWRRLDALLTKVEGRSVAKLTDEELLAIPVLYRAALSSLSVARATSLDHSLIDYLEALSTRAYFFVYGARASLRERLTQFFVSGWPAAVRSLWRETLVSLAITALATLVGYLLVQQDSSWYAVLVSNADGRDPTASTKFLHDGLYDGANAKHGLALTAAYVFQNNAGVAIWAFALGFAFCIPTIFLLIENGLMLGAFFALYVSRGLGFQLGGWLFIHGATELFAVVLGGAAGLKIGWSVIFPGERTRLESAAAAGRAAAGVLAGVVVMLIFAGLLEGFARQLITNDALRYAIAVSTLTIWLGYFYLPRPGRRPA
jgi:uncharacterized membrane protein SpoIIM required for sporulation